jgi:pimeloyl-ACP methyl ester carboxylesterase
MQHLLLLHGALGGSHYFDFMQAVWNEKYTVHTPIFEGHAGTKLHTDVLTIAYYVEQLAAYCDSRQLENIYLFGYSMGGYIALAFAIKYPKKVDKIMTLATKYHWSTQIAIKETSFLNPTLILEKVPKYAQQLQTLHGDEQWDILVNAIAQLLRHLGDNPILNEQNLKEIACRVQVMVGDKDTMVSIDESRQLADAIPGSNFAILPNTIHPFEKINQKLMLQLMDDFFTQ